MVLPALAGLAIGGGLLSGLGGLFGHSGPSALERRNTRNLENLAGGMGSDINALRKGLGRPGIAQGLMSQQMYANNRNLLGAASQMGGTGANQQLAIRNALMSGAQANAGAAGQMAAMGMQEELMKRQMIASMQGQLAGTYGNLVGIGAGRTAAKNQATQQAFGGISQGLLGLGTSMLGGGGGAAAPAQAALTQAAPGAAAAQQQLMFNPNTMMNSGLHPSRAGGVMGNWTLP